MTSPGTAPRAPARWLQGLRPLRHDPERRPGCSDARRSLLSPPQLAPKTRWLGPFHPKRHTLPDLYFYFEEEQCSGGPWLFSWLQFLLARELPLPCVLRLWDRSVALSAPALAAIGPPCGPRHETPHAPPAKPCRHSTQALAASTAPRPTPRPGSYFALSQSRETSLQARDHGPVDGSSVPRTASPLRLPCCAQELHIYVCLAILETCNEELMELDDAEVLWYLQHLPPMDMGQVLTQAFNIKDDVIASSLLT